MGLNDGEAGYKPIEKEETKSVSIDDLLEQLASKPNWKYCIAVLSLMLVWHSQPAIVYMTVFAGVVT